MACLKLRIQIEKTKFTEIAQSNLPRSVVRLSRRTVCVWAGSEAVVASDGRRGRGHVRSRSRRGRDRVTLVAGWRGVAGISGRGTAARQCRALPDARRRYAPLRRVMAATVTRGRQRFVVPAAEMILARTNDAGAAAPGQRVVGRVRVVLLIELLMLQRVAARRLTLWRRPCGRQVGRLLPDQSGRRQVPGRPRPRPAHGAVLLVPAALAAAAVQRARAAAVRRSHGGCRVRPGQRGRRRRHRVHDRGRPGVQRGRLLSGTVRVVAPIVVTVVAIVRRNDRNEPLGRQVIPRKL